MIFITNDKSICMGFPCKLIKNTVVGRLNNKGDSECIYNPDSVGCFIISHSFDEKRQLNKEKLDEICKVFNEIKKWLQKMQKQYIK